MNYTIISISFNDLDYQSGLNLQKDWIDKKINLFMTYLYKNLLKQSSQNFTVYLKYDDLTEAFIEESLKKYPQLPENILFIKKSQTLSTLTKQIHEKKFKHLFVLHLDIDMILRHSLIEKLDHLEVLSNTKYIVIKEGYLWDTMRMRLAKYAPDPTQFVFLVYTKENEELAIRHCILNSFPNPNLNERIDLNKENFLMIVDLKNPWRRYLGIPYTTELTDERSIIETILSDYF